MDTNKSKVSVSAYMLNNSRAEFVLVSSNVIMHSSILNKKNIFRASDNLPVYIITYLMFLYLCICLCLLCRVVFMHPVHKAHIFIVGNSVICTKSF